MANEIATQEIAVKTPSAVEAPSPEPAELAIVPTYLAVAVNGTEMAAARTKIRDFVVLRVNSIDQELCDLQASHDAAVRHKWDAKPFKRQLARVAGRRMYYGKILAALDQGFTIVPNMEVDVFAIRVDRARPATRARESKSRYSRSRPWLADETEQRLAVGEGRYESPNQTVQTRHWDTEDDRKETVHHVRTVPTGFAAIDFPIAVANPIVMDATARAMALQIFDRIGIVPATERRADPIVLGQVRLKAGTWEQTASFLIAWYLDPRTL